MAEGVYSIFENVALKDLTEKMIILEFTDFSHKYAPMDELTCKWLIHNFKGTKAQIIRNDEKLNVLVEKMMPGDSLRRLHSLPENLKKITIVNPKLIKELEFRGFTKFKIQVPKGHANQKLVRRQKSIQNASVLIDEVKENKKNREEATKAIESFMDNARDGKAEIGEVVNYVDGLTENSSAEAMSAIVSLKASDQTYAHCVDVAVIFQTAYFDILKKTGRKSVFKSEKEAMLASFMHDFGKSQVPKEILDSTVRFERDSREFQLIISHPQMGAELLNEMGLPDYIVNMCHYHHVKMDTAMKSSYPQVASYDEVIMETRLISIVDVYQALVGKRSYKKSWTPPAAIRYLDALAGVEFDPDTWDLFYKSMGLYPVSSLVQLNDGSLAFVMNVPQEDEERPQVAVVRNPNGMDLTHHEFIDLAEEKDISIEKDIDHQEVFDDGLEIFMNLNLS